eukprot:9178-Heterococcus_DN1.PRE.1
MEIIDTQVEELKKLWKNKRQLAFQGLNLAMIVLSALMIWKGLMVVTRSESPVVVVLSGSMEPAFQRGDILFLNNQNDPIRVGEVVVFKIKDRDIPIVHRIMKVHENQRVAATPLPAEEFNCACDCTGIDAPKPIVGAIPDGRVEVLTKGDNNRIDDRQLYAPGQQWLQHLSLRRTQQQILNNDTF